MKILKTDISGIFLIEPEPILDERGFFARMWCKKTASDYGLATDFTQNSISFNKQKHTLRGLHYQAEPHQEIKLIQCIKGEIFDALVDLRPQSATYGKHISIILNDENRFTLYVPDGIAHGFQTLTDNAEIFYQISTPYVPHAAQGIRWNDPELSIAWPCQPSIISDKDNKLPLLNDRK